MRLFLSKSIPNYTFINKENIVYILQVILLFSFNSTILNGQVYTYTGATNGAAGSLVANLTSTALTRQNGLVSSTACPDGFNSQNFSTASTWSNGVSFVEFILTPTNNHILTLSSISSNIWSDKGASNGSEGPDSMRYSYTISSNGTEIVQSIGNYLNPKNPCDNFFPHSWTFGGSSITVPANANINFKLYFYFAEISTAPSRIASIVVNGTAPLPIELLTFTATTIPTGIALKWSTASEVNNAYVAVERSSDGNRFGEITRLPGEGDSFEPRNYSHTDENPEKGTNYYRLRQVDFDGTETYSPVVQASFGKASRLSLYPSPAVERLTVVLNETEGEPVRWDVYDVAGRLVLNGSADADVTEFPVELTDLPKGVYTLQVFLGREVMTERFVKK